MDNSTDMKKRIIAEFIGTFLLLFTSCMAYIVNNINSKIGYLGVALAFGVALGVSYYLFHKVSGAHFNPAISLTYFITAKITIKELILYILSQIIAGLLACLLLLVIFADRFYSLIMTINNTVLACNDLSAKVVICICEFIFSFALLFVYVSVDNKKSQDKNAAIIIGATYFVIALVLLLIDGFGINILRVIIPSLFRWQWGNILYYVLSIVFGSLLGGISSKILFSNK